MTRSFRGGSVLLLAALLAAGCGRPDDVPGQGGEAADNGKHLLAAEPPGARGVTEVRKAAKDGDEVVVVARVGGSGKPFSPGRALFTVVDLSLEPCQEDGCDNPWCCADEDELKAGTAVVRFADAQGKTLAQDAQKLLGLKLLQTVVVKGKAKRDEQGNLTVVASGLYVKP